MKPSRPLLRQATTRRFEIKMARLQPSWPQLTSASFTCSRAGSSTINRLSVSQLRGRQGPLTFGGFCTDTAVGKLFVSLRIRFVGQKSNLQSRLTSLRDDNREPKGYLQLREHLQALMGHFHPGVVAIAAIPQEHIHSQVFF